MAFAAPVVSEDEIFRRRLLFDGEGLGDEQRLSNLLKGALKFCMTKEERKDDVVQNKERLLAAIDCSASAMTRSALVQKINREEAEHCNQLCKDTEAKIIQVQQNIVKNLDKLLQAKKDFMHKQICSCLTGAIKDQSTRKEMIAKLEELRKEIHILQKQKLELAMKLGRRSQLCHHLGSSVIEVQNIIRERDAADGDVYEESHAKDIVAMDNS